MTDEPIEGSGAVPPVEPAIVEQIEHTPEEVAAAVDAINDPRTLTLGPDALVGLDQKQKIETLRAELEGKQDEFGNMLRPTIVGEGDDAKVVLVSPVEPIPNTDPFPDAAFPAYKTVLIGASTAKHGGYVRQNPDGSFSFKPTSYIGPVITAPTLSELSAKAP